MAFKDKFRRALNRSSTTTRSNSSSSASSTTLDSSATASLTTTPTLTTSPTSPSITLTKTSSRLSKKLTWTSRSERRSDKEARQRKKREEEWEEFDRNFVYKPGKRRNAEMLRGWEWSFRGSMDEGKRGSVWSGVSPGASRVGSVADQGGRGSFQSSRRGTTVEGVSSADGN